MRKRLAAIARMATPDLRDVLVFGGLAAVSYGVAQFSVPAAWIVGGSGLFWLGTRSK